MTETDAGNSTNLPTGSSSTGKKVVATLLIVVVLGLFLWSAPSLAQGLQRIFRLNQYATYSHDELVDYALALVNSDRALNGLTSVTLSSVTSGQQHADDMLQQHYFSHWDTNGDKPYMRYTLAGGTGFVEENIAWYYSSGSFDAEAAIKDLEWQMMYNDSGSNWGHMYNILNPAHNEINIGIALDTDNLYLVQDFENDYTQWTALNFSASDEVTMNGTIQGINRPMKQINIYYDSSPVNLTPQQLEQPPYSDGYTLGTFVGMALPPRSTSSSGITITAQTWTQSGQQLLVRFSLSEALSIYGKGVYTLYLQPGSSTEAALTSYSIWYT
jgi:uncharacterized protein YkwD